MGSLWDYVVSRQEELATEAIQSLLIVAESMLVATLIGVGIAFVAYRRPRVARISLTGAAVMLTVPSFALLGLLIPPLGLGVGPAFVALVLYALLPIIRNAIVGLQSVDPAIVDAARGMGLSRTRTLIRVELPLAWPVILTGIRVSTQLILGISAIAAYVAGPGLGNSIFSGLSRFGGAGALESALAGTLGIVLLALLFDSAYLLVGRLTTSRGLRV